MYGMAILASLSGTVCAGVAGFLETFSGATSFCFALLVCTELGGSFSFLSPNSTSRNYSIAFNYSIGALFGCCLIASSNCLAASRILSPGVSCGIEIACCLNCTVSDILSAPVDGSITLKFW